MDYEKSKLGVLKLKSVPNIVNYSIIVQIVSKFGLRLYCTYNMHWTVTTPDAKGINVMFQLKWICVFIRAGNSLIRSFRSNQMRKCQRFTQIAQDKWATVSESLRLLKPNEQARANSSGRSWQMSNRERIAQVTHDKWANWRFAQKIWQKDLKSYFFVCFI